MNSKPETLPTPNRAPRPARVSRWFATGFRCAELKRPEDKLPLKQCENDWQKAEMLAGFEYGTAGLAHVQFWLVAGPCQAEVVVEAVERDLKPETGNLKAEKVDVSASENVDAVSPPHSEPAKKRGEDTASTLEKSPIDNPQSPMLERAIEVIRATKRASTAGLQRRLKIGYNAAAALMDELEDRGIIGPPTGTGPREIIDLPQGVTAPEQQAKPVPENLRARPNCLF